MHLFMEDLVYGIFKNHLNSILKTKLEINIDSVSNNHYFQIAVPPKITNLILIEYTFEIHVSIHL